MGWLVITLFSCYQPFHSNNINDSASPEFIRLSLMIRETKQGILLNSISLIPGPTQRIVLGG